jgi:hypothetical protein
VQHESIKTLLAIRAHPALQSPKLDTVLAGELGQWNAVLKRRPKESETLERPTSGRATRSRIQL